MKMPKNWKYVPSWAMQPNYLAEKFASLMRRRRKQPQPKTGG